MQKQGHSQKSDGGRSVSPYTLGPGKTMLRVVRKLILLTIIEKK